MEKVKLALIGCGNVAQVVHLPVLEHMPDVEIVAVIDPDKRKAQAIALRSHIPNVFTSLDAMLDSPVAKDVHAVDICTPTDTHRPIAIQAMENGLDVLVEKPMSRTAKEAREMSAVAEEHKRKLMV